MTKKKGQNARTRDARRYARQHQVRYTAALRAVDAQHQYSREQALPLVEPPYLVLRDYIGAPGCGKTFRMQDDLLRSIAAHRPPWRPASENFSCWVVIDGQLGSYRDALSRADLVTFLDLPASQGLEEIDAALGRPRIKSNEVFHLTSPEGVATEGVGWALLALCADVPTGGIINLMIDPYDPDEASASLNGEALDWAARTVRSSGRRIKVTRSLMKPDGFAIGSGIVHEPHVGYTFSGQRCADAAKVLGLPRGDTETLSSLPVGVFLTPEAATNVGP